MNTVYGNLVDLAKNGKFDVIIHGCNCFYTMNTGLAKRIKLVFPAVYKADRETDYAVREKLGTYSSCKVKVKDDKELTIVNGYTQYKCGTYGCYINYNIFRRLFKRIKDDF